MNDILYSKTTQLVVKCKENTVLENGSLVYFITIKRFPTNAPRVFRVETTWKRSFLRRFNVEYTLCVCMVTVFSFPTDYDECDK